MIWRRTGKIPSSFAGENRAIFGTLARSYLGIEQPLVSRNETSSDLTGLTLFQNRLVLFRSIDSSVIS